MAHRSSFTGTNADEGEPVALLAVGASLGFAVITIVHHTSIVLLASGALCLVANQTAIHLRKEEQCRYAE
jgi:hypothetical protein